MKGGLIGALAGFATSAVLFKVMPRKYPSLNITRLPYSVKTAFWITPPTVLTVILAEEASNKYDALKYSAEQNEFHDSVHDAQKQLAVPTINEKLFEKVYVNKYKIITAAWAGSLWGSWVLVNRDKIMTTSQKIVQARMYAQFITVALLLASVGLSVYENKLHPNKQNLKEQHRWEKALKYAERQEEAEKNKTGFVSNEERISSQIFK